MKARDSKRSSSFESEDSRSASARKWAAQNGETVSVALPTPRGPGGFMSMGSGGLVARPGPGGTGGTPRPVATTAPEGALPLSETTRLLRVELARKPPDAVAISNLLVNAQVVARSTQESLAGYPTDLVAEPAAAAATALGGFQELAEQAAALPGLDSRTQELAAMTVLGMDAAVQSAEALAAMSEYVREPTEANFDHYVREFADVQVASQVAGLEGAIGQLEGGLPGDWATLALQAAEVGELRAFVNTNPHEALDASLSTLNQSAISRTVARQEGLTWPITSEQLLALPPAERQRIAGLMTSAMATEVMAPPPPGQPQPTNATAADAGAQLDQALATLQQLEQDGISYETANALARTRLAELVTQNPALGVLDTEALSRDFLGDVSTSLSFPGGALAVNIAIQDGSGAFNALHPSNRERLLAQAGLQGLPGDTRLTSAYLGELGARVSDLEVLGRNLEQANPPPTAKDLLPTAGLAMEALVARLGNPSEAFGSEGAPGPLGQAIMEAGKLFQRYGEEKGTEARTDLAIGLGAAAAGIAAGILSGGTAAPLLIAALSATSLAGTGYSMYRTTESFVEAKDLARFGELSGVSEPDDFQFVLEQGLNLLGLGGDAAMLLRSLRVMRGVDAVADAALAVRSLSSLDELVDSALGLRLAGRLDDGAQLSQESLTVLRTLGEGGYTFDDVARVLNEGATHPAALNAEERALFDIARAERLYTPEALDLFRRYQLATGTSVDDAYRAAMVAADGDPALIPRQLAEDFLRWNSRPSTVSSAMEIVNLLPGSQGLLKTRAPNAIVKTAEEAEALQGRWVFMRGGGFPGGGGCLWMQRIPDNASIDQVNGILAELHKFSSTFGGSDGVRMMVASEGFDPLAANAAGDIFLRSDGLYAANAVESVPGSVQLTDNALVTRPEKFIGLLDEDLSEVFDQGAWLSGFNAR